MTREELNALIEEIDPKNAEYIREDGRILDEWAWMNRYAEDGKDDMYAFCLERLKEKISTYDDRRLVPSNAKVGDGATLCLYTDRHACTIVKVTKSTITLQRDKAILDPNFKPIREPGGFAGHCINQDEQSYTYERNPKGELTTIHWSRAYSSYGRPGDLRAVKGRHEFYDYNF